MAFRIGDFVVYGELRNTERNKVGGWLAFDDERSVKLELTGNLTGDLAGCNIRFEVLRDAQPAIDEETYESLQKLQIGTPGDVLLRMVKVPLCGVEEFMERGHQGERPPVEERPCLYLEWYSQNGRVVAEIIDPQIEHVVLEDKRKKLEPIPLPDQETASHMGVSVTAIERTPDGNFVEVDYTDTGEEENTDDPYNLFKPELSNEIRNSSRDLEPDDKPTALAVDSPDDDWNLTDENRSETEFPPKQLRSWDEVIPGIDPETKKMYEQWDEISHGNRDVPLGSLFDPPLELPSVDQVTSEEHADSLVKMLLMRLAMHNVAIDVCEHFSALDIYRYLMEQVLPDAEIHPDLPSTGWIQHFCTWESCPKCEKEYGEV